MALVNLDLHTLKLLERAVAAYLDYSAQSDHIHEVTNDEWDELESILTWLRKETK